MAQRANKLISGEGFCVDAIRNHEAHVILLASDAGMNTTKKIIDKAMIAVIKDYTMEKQQMILLKSYYSD